jgi:hypothetical protein
MVILKHAAEVVRNAHTGAAAWESGTSNPLRFFGNRKDGLMMKGHYSS